MRRRRWRWQGATRRFVAASKDLMQPTFVIRPGVAEDVKAVAALLADSAESQGARDSLCVDENALLRDGFGPEPRFELLVAAADSEIVGIGLYFFTYSTWTSANGLFLEDLYVAPRWRRRGIAAALMRALARIARERGCGRFEWGVQRSNEAAIRFYESLGANIANVWVMQLNAAAIDKLTAANEENGARG